MNDNIQESLRGFVRQLEGRGYDRDTALRMVLDIAGRHASAPPKGRPPTIRARRG